MRAIHSSLLWATRNIIPDSDSNRRASMESSVNGMFPTKLLWRRSSTKRKAGGVWIGQLPARIFDCILERHELPRVIIFRSRLIAITVVTDWMNLIREAQRDPPTRFLM